MSNRDHGRCLVCGDVSIGFNFGVPTCMPCKAFFRRNALKLKTQEFVCQHDGDCLITYEYRRSCNCCRLAKCFRVGMKKTLILSDEERIARNNLVARNRLKRGKIPNRPCTEWMQTPSLLRLTPNSCYPLSSSDQIALANIFYIYENTCMIAKKTQFQSFPTVQHKSLHEFLNEMSLIFPVFIEYFKHIPEFAKIVIDDKIRLVKNHFSTIVNINEPLMHPVTSSNLIITWTNVFGVRATECLVKRNRIMEQYIVDPIVLKIVLIILVLSSSTGRYIADLDIDQICDDSLTIFAAQNIYVELLWRYILSRTEVETDAVKYFNKLMMCILYMKNIDIQIDAYINSLKDEIRLMEPMMQSMWPRMRDEENVINTYIDENIINSNSNEDMINININEDIINTTISEDISL